VRDIEVIAITQVPLSPAVLTTVTRCLPLIRDICNVAVIKNPDDTDETLASEGADFVEEEDGMSFPLKQWMGMGDTWFENLFHVM
jgi:hypothetical protein